MLKINNLNKKFGNNEILKNINLEIKEGEFLTLVGESGSGKSTLLRIIAGLEEPSQGEILNLNNQDISKQNPRDRNFAMVFQSYALYPHLSVRENLTMPIKARAKNLSINFLWLLFILSPIKSLKLIWKKKLNK
ncbi:ATP-binding cassette domain-containing protein [Campylobacter jejuni]|nr:ABC transporter ATP-binding protein [Campylobacter jejuni]